VIDLQRRTHTQIKIHAGEIISEKPILIRDVPVGAFFAKVIPDGGDEKFIGKRLIKLADNIFRQHPFPYCTKIHYGSELYNKESWVIVTPDFEGKLLSNRHIPNLMRKRNLTNSFISIPPGQHFTRVHMNYGCRSFIGQQLLKTSETTFKSDMYDVTVNLNDEYYLDKNWAVVKANSKPKPPL
jgi:hypothetical protein